MIKQKMISFIPYERKGSYAFIKHAKKGENDTLIIFLR
jgi:hypothetical protein